MCYYSVGLLLKVETEINIMQFSKEIQDLIRM